MGFLDLIWTVAVVVVVWRDWREPPEVSPGLRTHIASMVESDGGISGGKTIAAVTVSLLKFL